MKVEIPISLRCPENMLGHIQKVLSGEYDIPWPYARPENIIDLGGNIGGFALWASHRWPGSRIFSCEPHPRNIELFRENLKHYPDVTLIECAVGRPTGFQPLYEGLNNCGEHSLKEMSNNLKLNGFHVEVIDPLKLPAADIIKLDIEGSELDVLSALIEDGRKFKAILYEYHSVEIQLKIDLLLEDYSLVKADIIAGEDRGTLCYLNKELI